MPLSEWLASDALTLSARLEPSTWKEVPGQNPTGGLAFHNSWTDIPQKGYQGEIITPIASTLGLAFSQSSFFGVWGSTLHPPLSYSSPSAPQQVLLWTLGSSSGRSGVLGPSPSLWAQREEIVLQQTQTSAFRWHRLRVSFQIGGLQVPILKRSSSFLLWALSSSVLTWKGPMLVIS